MRYILSIIGLFVLSAFPRISMCQTATDQLGITGNLNGLLPLVSGNVKMGWNLTAGQGEADFFNAYLNTSGGPPVTSFCWYQYSTPTSVMSLACLGPTGVFYPNNGVKIGVNFPAQSSGWLEAIIPATETAASNTFVSLSNAGGSAGVFGTRSSDGSSSGSESGFAIGSFAINDNSTVSRNTYSAYFEARRYAAVNGVTQGLEVGITNQGGVVHLDPWNMSAAGSTLPFRASAGRGDVAGESDISSVFTIISGPVKFDKGIIFGSDSLAIGPSGAEALVMANGQGAVWYAQDGSTTGISALIRSDATVVTATPLTLVLTNTDFNFVTRDGVHSLVVGNGQVTTTNLQANGQLVLSNCPSSPSGLASGTLWCNGNVVNRVP